MRDTPSTELLELGISKSNVEEIIGILWAILAVMAVSGVIYWIAVVMALVSFGGAIRYAVTELRQERALRTHASSNSREGGEG